MSIEQRFLLTVGYQAGRDTRIQRGADGYRDCFTPQELEKAAWSLLRSGAPTCGLFHVDGTEGAADIVESSIWRAPDPWILKAVDGTQVEIKMGDWLVGMICDPVAWDLYKSGKVGGVSPQGTAKRRSLSPDSFLAKEVVLAKSAALGDEDEMTELYDAQVPRLDLVGKGANGMPFLIAKSGNGSAGLFDPDYVRGLIAKAEPEPAPPAREVITMSGSPAAIAALIHSAAVRKADAVDSGDYEQLLKAKYDTDDRKHMADNGQAMDDGSYPIADREDLTRAIRAVGRGGAEHDAIRRHIISRASAIGASGEIPDDWAADGSLKKAASAMDEDLDPTVVLADAEGDAPGMDTDPGSPAWEEVDAATARKWTAILARAKGALQTLADREMLESASADPEDVENAFDLGDAACAIDYAIGVLAPYAVAEQAAADCGDDMHMVGKALAGFDPAALEVIEGLGPIRKAGRVLSAANEAAIRGAVEQLQKVLTSLPAAPTTTDDGQPVTKSEETDMPTMPEPERATETEAASGQIPTMGIEKAAGDPMLVVYDKDGNAIGLVDPSKLTQIANGDSKDTAADDGAASAEPAPDGAAAAPPTDLTPAPAAEVGTPADAVPAAPAADDDGTMTKSTPEDTTALVKSTVTELLTAALDDYSARQADVVKTALDERSAEQAELIKALEQQNTAQAAQIDALNKSIQALEQAPAVREVVRNGALPPPHLMRGQDHGQNGAIDVAAARERREALYKAQNATEQRDIAESMQADAIAALAAIHARR